MTRRPAWILLMAALVIASVILYRGNYLYDQAKGRTSNIEKKIALLEMEQTILPVNDLLYHELGKSYFDAGVNRLQDAGRRDANFAKSYACFLRSLTLNPLSAFAHFDFAQALQYLNFLDLNVRESYFEEYKKAARLSGQNIQIFTEVGKVLLSRWAGLTPDEKRLGLDISRRVLAAKDPEKTSAYLELWDLNVRDYGILDKMLPADGATYLAAARYLGEKSLDRNERLKYLSLAETLAFRAAKEEFFAAQTEANALRIPEAKARYEAALRDLGAIAFYQNLTDRSPIDSLEHKNLLKAAHLGRAKCILEETRRLDGALEDLYAYLGLESQSSALGDLESFMAERGIVDYKSAASSQDFRRFAFQLSMSFLQSRYREIVQAGQALEKSLLVIPEGTRRDYARVLELVGDSYRKLDYIYESNNFYQKAIDTDVREVGLLLKMRKNYERLNDPEKIRAIDAKIEGLLTIGERMFTNRVLLPGEFAAETLVLNGRKFALTLSFGELGTPRPLVSVSANGQVVWEDYLQGPALTLSLLSVIGQNDIKIAAINKPVSLLKIKVVLEESSSASNIKDVSLKRKK